jgi:hypothetical protein
VNEKGVGCRGVELEHFIDPFDQPRLIPNTQFRQEGDKWPAVMLEEF